MPRRWIWSRAANHKCIFVFCLSFCT